MKTLVSSTSHFHGSQNLKSGFKWWQMYVILALGRLRQEDHEFKASLDYIHIKALSKKKKNTF
jgi:hypothetical protein